MRAATPLGDFAKRAVVPKTVRDVPRAYLRKAVGVPIQGQEAAAANTREGDDEVAGGRSLRARGPLGSLRQPALFRSGRKGWRPPPGAGDWSGTDVLVQLRALTRMRRWRCGLITGVPMPYPWTGPGRMFVAGHARRPFPAEAARGGPARRMPRTV